MKAVDVKDFFNKGDTSENKDGTLTMKEDELIRRRPNGTFNMIKSNFDFLEKPRGYLDSEEFMANACAEESKREEVKVLYRKGKKQKSGKNLISSVFVDHTRAINGASRKPKTDFV